MIGQHERRDRSTQLAAHGRQWGDLAGYLDGMADWARWLIERPGAFHRKTVKLAHEERDEMPRSTGAQEILRSRRAHHRGRPNDGVTLLIAPTGSRKSTEMRRRAVRIRDRASDRSDESVVILVPRHKLGDEQIKALQRGAPRRRFHRRSMARPASRGSARRSIRNIRARLRDVLARRGGQGAGRRAARRREPPLQARPRAGSGRMSASACCAATSARSGSRPISGSPRTNAWCTRCRRRSATWRG